MLKENPFIFSFFIILSLIVSGCSVVGQIKDYTSYHIHDIYTDKGNLYVLFEKQIHSPELSLHNTLKGGDYSGSKYDLISYHLLSFNIINFSKKDHYIEFNKKYTLLKNKNINYYNRMSIIDKNRIFSLNDFIGNDTGKSIIFIGNKIISFPVIDNNSHKGISFCTSFDSSKTVYPSNDKIMMFDADTKQRLPIENMSSDDFQDTYYMADNGKWFFDRVGEDLSNLSYIFEIVDKENKLVMSRFLTKSRNFQDYNNKIEDGRLLTYDSRYGLEIIDLDGNILYSLQDEAFRMGNFIKADMDENNVYTAGITIRKEPHGAKAYIEILQWDYKNNKVTKKYYPCDSPELEM